MRLVNTFEGGSDETQISTANSGTGGDAFDATSTATGATRVFDDAQTMYGTLSMRYATAGTSGSSRGSWRPTAFSRAYGRTFFRISSTSAVRTLCGIRDNVGGVIIGRVSIGTGAKLFIADSTATTIATGSTSIALNTWYRVEWSLGIGASASATARLYAGDSTALLEQISATGDFGTTNADDISWGQLATVANVPDGWLDCIEVRDDGYPGPWVRANGALGCG